MGHPGLHPQHLKLRLWLALSSLLTTQGAAVCLAEDSMGLSGGRAALEVYRLTFAAGRWWLWALDCSGSLLKAAPLSLSTLFSFRCCVSSVCRLLEVGSLHPASGCCQLRLSASLRESLWVVCRCHHCSGHLLVTSLAPK